MPLSETRFTGAHHVVDLHVHARLCHRNAKNGNFPCRTMLHQSATLLRVGGNASPSSVKDESARGSQPPSGITYLPSIYLGPLRGS